MKFKVTIFVLLFIVTLFSAHAQKTSTDSLILQNNVLDIDSILEKYTQKAPQQTIAQVIIKTKRKNVIKSDTIEALPLVKHPVIVSEKPNIGLLKQDTATQYVSTHSIELQAIDTLLLQNNPLFIDLIYKGLSYSFKWDTKPDLGALYHGNKAFTLNDSIYRKIKTQSNEDFIASLRNEIRDEITRKSVYLYTSTFDRLPEIMWNRNNRIYGKPLSHVNFVDNNIVENKKQFQIKEVKISPWFHKGSAMAQFSQNTVSSNWYQGGNNNIAILGILSGQLNYNNKKTIQWENSAEWRIGFNSVDGDTLRMLSTNDDVFKINSKLGIKAGGNFFYSGSVDFSTQFFDSYKGINSTTLKTAFLTPIRVNVGIGLDYKYKKILSLLVSPISFKYIYMNDAINVAPNLFGINTGENHLSQTGSSFKATFSYPISHEIQLDSKLSFYTNYEKVEIDWEIVCNMAINRFMSTRISFNPRYDNTVIMAKGESAKIQYKQFVSVGFSHKF